MIAEGKISVELGRDGSVWMHSNRTADVGRLLVGRSPDQVMALLPLVFTLCGHAHAAAARQAMTLATPDQARSDALVVLAENAREHLLRIMMCWQTDPKTSTLPVPAMMSLIAQMRQATGDYEAEQKRADHLDELLEAHILGLPSERFLRMASLAEFREWLAQSTVVGAKFIAAIFAKNWQAAGGIATYYMPDLSQDQLKMRLVDPAYMTSPDWLGQPCETGPLARQNAHPLLRVITDGYGNGLLARLVARLVDLAKIPDQMRNPEIPVYTANGLGIVETARGRLIHAAKFRDETVTEYRILAPTEWNFHPNGAAVQALKTLHPASDRAERARALIEAIDPCVDFDVKAA